jgi:hydrogenase nickel incorporation protein HypA/HybF
MHELAIAESVVSSVLERTGSRRVRVVRLRIGRLCAVVPDALTFSFELATAGTPLAGAALEVEDQQARARCRSCGAEFTLENAFLLCPCGSADVALLSGRDLTIVSVEVDDRCAAPADAERPRSG